MDVVPTVSPLNVRSRALNDSFVPVPLNKFAWKVPVAVALSLEVTEPKVPGAQDT